jgi:hypothetical protein
LPEDDLIARAIIFSQQTLGFGRAEFEGATYRTSVETVAGRLKELTASDKPEMAKVRFILDQALREPQLLALFSVIWHQTPLTSLNAEGITDPAQAKSPEKKMLDLARDLAQGEQVAKYLSQGRKIPANILASGNSYLAQIVNAAAPQTGAKANTFALGAGVDGLHPERLLALSIFKNQAEALRKYAEAQGVKLSVEGPMFSTVLGFHPEDAQILETYKKAVDLARTLNVPGITVQEDFSVEVKAAVTLYAQSNPEKSLAAVSMKLTAPAGEIMQKSGTALVPGASKAIAAARTETYTEVAQRAAQSATQLSEPYQQALWNNLAGIRAGLQHSISDSAVRARVEKGLEDIVSGKTNLTIRTVDAIEGGIAVQQLAAEKLNVIMEAQMPAALRDSTFIHEALEAALQQRFPQADFPMLTISSEAALKQKMPVEDWVSQAATDAVLIPKLSASMPTTLLGRLGERWNQLRHGGVSVPSLRNVVPESINILPAIFRISNRMTSVVRTAVIGSAWYAVQTFTAMGGLIWVSAMAFFNGFLQNAVAQDTQLSAPSQFAKKALSLPSGARLLFRQFGLPVSVRGVSFVLGVALMGWAGLSLLPAQVGINFILPAVIVGMAAFLPARYLTLRFKAAGASSALRDTIESPDFQAALERLSTETPNPTVVASISRELLKTLGRVSDDAVASGEVLNALSALADIPGVESSVITVILSTGARTLSIPTEVLNHSSLLNRLMILPVLDQNQKPMQLKQNSRTLDSAA